jgi:adenylate cyclase
VSVRLKIILVVLPLLIVTLVLSSIASSLSARNGITRVAVELLAFKAQDMEGYLENQLKTTWRSKGFMSRPHSVPPWTTPEAS